MPVFAAPGRGDRWISPFPRCGLACTCLPAASATTPSSRREGRVRICRTGQSWPVAAMWPAGTRARGV